MTDDMAQDPSTRRGQETSGWAVGFILFAAISATVNFLLIPYYPFWSLLIIALDIFVIWALVAHGREFSDARS